MITSAYLPCVGRIAFRNSSIGIQKCLFDVSVPRVLKNVVGNGEGFALLQQFETPNALFEHQIVARHGSPSPPCSHRRPWSCKPNRKIPLRQVKLKRDPAQAVS